MEKEYILQMEWGDILFPGIHPFLGRKGQAAQWPPPSSWPFEGLTDWLLVRCWNGCGGCTLAPFWALAHIAGHEKDFAWALNGLIDWPRLWPEKRNGKCGEGKGGRRAMGWGNGKGNGGKIWEKWWMKPNGFGRMATAAKWLDKIENKTLFIFNNILFD
jgi:hypothetical protein